MLHASHALGVAIVLHSCLHEILIDGRQNGNGGIEACVEEHLVCLDLEGTALIVSQCRLPSQENILQRFTVKGLARDFRSLDGQAIRQHCKALAQRHD